LPRLFVALDLPEAVLMAARDAQVGLPEGSRPAPFDALHLTLHFLGEAPETVVYDLAEALQRLPRTPVPLAVQERLVLPNQRRPRVLALALTSSAALTALHAAAGQVIAEAGFALDPRPFRPHVTVARLRDGRPDAVCVWKDAAAPGRSETMGGEAVALVLYESRLTPERAVYVPRVTIPLR